MKNTFLLGAVAILIAATLFGIAGALAKALFHADISPFALTAIRTLLACALFAGVILVAPRLSFRVKREALPILIAAGIAFTSVNVTFYLAISMISVAGAITLEYTAPLFVLIISFLAGTKRITVVDVLIVSASVVGCFLLSWDGGTGLFHLSPGILIGLVCGLSFAIYNIIGMLDPLTAGVFAFLLLGEVLTIPNLTGIAIIIVAVCAFTAKEIKTPAVASEFDTCVARPWCR